MTPFLGNRLLLEIVLRFQGKNESECAKICTLFTGLGFKIDSLLWFENFKYSSRLLKFDNSIFSIHNGSCQFCRS